MRFSLIAVGLVFATPLFVGDALSQNATPPAPKVEALSDEPVSGNETLHAVTARIDWPTNAATGKHTHAGDEYAYVVQGRIEVTTEGQAPHIYEAGQAYHNRRGVVHEARNAGRRPATTVAVMVVDKGGPLSQPVK